jgi:iron complex transport system substrate-binding protein
MTVGPLAPRGALAAAVATAASLAVAALAALAPLAACSRSSPTPATTTSGANGLASPVAAPLDASLASRVVSISPATTEALFAIGAGDHVVGRSRYCDWPPEATKLPVVGGILDADLEAIVQLSPDLLVGGPGPPSDALAQKLAPFKVPTWFPRVDSFADIEAMVLGAGDRTGHAEDARRVVDGPDGIRARVAAVEHAVAGEAAPRVLFVVDLSPVVAAGPGDFIDEMIRRAGGANALDVGGAWQNLGFERIVDLDPDVVVDASSANGEALDASSANGGSGATRIQAKAAGWAEVRAVREGHVVTLNDARVLRRKDSRSSRGRSTRTWPCQAGSESGRHACPSNASTTSSSREASSPRGRARRPWSSPVRCSSPGTASTRRGRSCPTTRPSRSTAPITPTSRAAA